MQQDGLAGEVFAAPQRSRQLAQRRLPRLPAPLVFPPAIGKIPRDELRDTEIEMGVAEIGSIGDRTTIMLDRFRQAALCPINQPEIVVGLGHIRGEGEGAAKAFRRFAELIMSKLCSSQLADDGGIVRFQRDSPT